MLPADSLNRAAGMPGILIVPPVARHSRALIGEHKNGIFTLEIWGWDGYLKLFDCVLNNTLSELNYLTMLVIGHILIFDIWDCETWRCIKKMRPNSVHNTYSSGD